MKHAPIFVSLLLATGACVAERSLEVDVREAKLPRGAGIDVAIRADGERLPRLEAFELAVDDPDIASATLTSDGAHVRIAGRGEGETTVRIGYHDAEVAIPTVVAPPAIVLLQIEPVGVSTEVGAMVPLRATALDTTGTLRDVTQTTAWQIEDPAIARIDATGVRGMASGQTLLRADFGDRITTVVVDVAP